MTASSTALIVEDDEDFAETLRALIARMGYTTTVATTLKLARQELLLRPPDVVLLDLELPDGNGMELFADAALLANCETVLITGHATLETSIQALRLGAADYLVKPVNLTQLQGILSRVTRPSAIRADLQNIEQAFQQTGRFGHLLGRSAAMQQVYAALARVAQTSVAVFIAGESGTGKEMAAQTVHELSRRKRQPFFGVNCGALTPTLIESQLFGHEKGAFTGAERQHVGFFERCHGGTLFLDEITEMPMELQVKLLRVLETGTFMRVGASQVQETDVRIIAATNRPPEKAVASGRLREDLFYRLNVFPIRMPALREHADDIPVLAESFLQAIVEREGMPRRFAADAFADLADHSWPGNVRELRNLVQRAYVMSEGPVIERRWLQPQPSPPAAAAMQPTGATVQTGVTMTAEPTPTTIGTPSPGEGRSIETAAFGGTPPKLVITVGMSLAEIEHKVIMATMAHYGQHKEKTAAVLGISIKTLYNRMKEYSQQANDGRSAEMSGSGESS